MAAAENLTASLPALSGSVDLRQCSKLAFLSDVHLQAAEPENYQAWAAYLARLQADALFVLGDLFEVWIGDDVLNDSQSAFERECLKR